MKIALLVITILLFVVPLSTILWLPPMGYTHSGKVLMTETEYRDFKCKMGQSETTHVDVSTLNSSEPILVMYSFEDKSNGKLYSDEEVVVYEVSGWWLLSVLCFIPLWKITEPSG